MQFNAKNSAFFFFFFFFTIEYCSYNILILRFSPIIMKKRKNSNSITTMRAYAGQRICPNFSAKKSYLINKYDNRCQLASKGKQGFGKLFSISKPLHDSGRKKNNSFGHNRENNRNAKYINKYMFLNN